MITLNKTLNKPYLITVKLLYFAQFESGKDLQKLNKTGKKKEKKKIYIESMVKVSALQN